MQARLFVAAAFAPLFLALATQATAQTTITDSRTTTVQTSTAGAGGTPANVTINSGAVISPTGGGSGVIIDSSNTVSNAGTITFNDLNDVNGVLIRGGFTGGYTQTGAINLLEGYTPTNADSDADLDGPFAQGSNRYAIRVVGPGTFTGGITTSLGSIISVEGNTSFGVSVETALVGNIFNQGTVGVLGNNSRAYSTTAAVTGDIRLLGTVAAQGQNATAVFVGGDLSGVLQLQGTIRATGYRSTDRAVLPATRAALDADDLLQGGAAVRIAADVGRGVLVDAPPTDTDAANADEDADGVADVNETTGLVRSFGAAPAIDIGADGRAVRLGAVGTGENAYGLVVRGQVLGDGVNDGVNAVGVRVGQTGAGAGATTLEGGLSVAAGGAVGANSYLGESTAVQVNAGANVGTIFNAGEISAVGNGDTAAVRATAIDIAAGATTTTLRNDGVITATINGEGGAATAVLDRSGGLSVIENRGIVIALNNPTDDSSDVDDPNSDPSDEVINGTRIAFDLRANTQGATLRQFGRTDSDTDVLDADGDGVDDEDEPAILGSVLFGSGADVLEVGNGVLTGDVAFGAGADRLAITGGGAVTGAITDADGRLAVDIANGALTLTNASAVNVTSVNVGGDGAITFSVDPGVGVGRLTASGAATIADGAQIGLRLASLQRGSAEYAVLSGSTLSVGNFDRTLLGSTPFLYVITPRVDQGANTLLISVRPRTPEELAFNRSQTDAFAGVFDSLDLNSRIETAILAQTSREGLVRIYDQLLPDHSGGAVLSLSAVNDAISNVLTSRTEPRGRLGPNGAWVQEVFFSLRQPRRDAQGAESQGFGVTGGFEGVGPDGGALGLTASFVTADFEDTDAVVGEQVTFSMFELGGYWRRQYRGLRFDARGAAGVVLFDSDRRLVSATDNLALTTEADWTGFSASGHLGVSYEYGNRYYLRPYAALDAIYLSEGDYAEEGGGAGFDLEVDSRSSSLLSASAGLTAGARFGGPNSWFGPELTVGYRGRVAGEPGSTTARFAGGSGTPFTLDAEDAPGGGLQIRLALRTGTQRGYLALEGGGEIDGDYERYDIRLVAKLFF